MGLDENLSERSIKMRKATGDMMDDIYKDLIPFVESSDFPHFIIPKIRELGINGLAIKDFGGPGLSQLEAGAIIMEIAKRDVSISTFFLVHNAIGMEVVN